MRRTKTEMAVKIASERSGYKCIAEGFGEILRDKIAVVLGHRGDSNGDWKSLRV